MTRRGNTWVPTYPRGTEAQVDRVLDRTDEILVERRQAAVARLLQELRRATSSPMKA